ncbi:DegT/DnrJ/EryC1/StrS family aminotransferase [Nocardia anaemiae]|uniref:DegT/DnrJ/EryC1/StrS family aminotransferase n=1 Tax=Nocardia anaemiae TaxID=263910 RepID=UPI000A96759B|nr:DegT/DnrJ/EryC1/StrS family aminotransferase [Nocardia anaemiae]
MTDHTETMVVPFFDGRRSFTDEWPEIERHLSEMFEYGKFSHGLKTEQLEQAVRQFTGARYAIGVNSGSDALLLLLRAAGIGSGDEVIVPCYTFFASVSAICHAGATPVFVDIDPDTYAVDPTAVAAAVNERTKAVIPVHLFNRMADMAAVTTVAARHGISVIEDSAEAIGMFHDGVHAGLLGAGGVLSFFPTKTLGALGDAGMVITDDPLIADRCAVLRHHGRMGQTIGRISGISNAASLSGTNSKMDEVQASVLLARIPRLNRAIARRAMWARFYDSQLAELPGIRLPAKHIQAQSNQVWYVYLIEVDDRDGLAEHLRNRGIGTEIYYPQPMHLQPCFAKLGYQAGDFPVAEQAAQRALALPLYPDLTEEAADWVCRAIAEFARSAR